MNTLYVRSFFAIVVALMLSACGGDDTTGGDNSLACVPGETSACVCAEGPTVGIQTCTEDGTFAACDCSGTIAPNGSTGGNTTTGMDAGAPEDGGNNGMPDDGGTAIPDGGNTTEDMGPTFVNACGGSAELDNPPGTVCGECNDGFFVCDGINEVRCAYASSLNACNSCARLNGAPGDACGPCKTGTLQCNASGVLECNGADDANACGGCSTLAERPGFFCQGPSGKSGTYACDSPDSVRCTAPDENVCGGQSVLTDQPATPCGTCGDGRYECASQDAVICSGASSAQNSCGGCGAPLVAEPNTACGACGGTWQCDGTQAVVCSAPINLCGGCIELAETPGADCGGGEIVTCDGALSTTCKDAATHNACGGTNRLGNEPGVTCGVCGDGKYVCAGNSATICVEDELTLNACGGCTPLQANPGEPCAPGSAWMCDGTDAVTCMPTMNNSGLNACGGTQMLDGRPGTTCESCGTWACDSVNADLVFCIGGSPGVLVDENNCGMCGMQCLPGEACVAGQCEFDTVIGIDASANHIVTYMAGGDVFAWGYNDRNGPIGNGTTNRDYYEPQPTSVIDDAIDVAAGDPGSTNAGVSCAIRANGDVWCWGSNARGALGTPASLLSRSPIPVKVNGIDNAIQIEVDEGAVCALKSDRTLWCWGNNFDGQLGQGTFGGADHVPTQVPGLTSVQDFAIATGTVCAVTTGGEAFCWGDDQYGSLGNGSLSTADSATPTKIEGTFAAFSAIEASWFGFVALNSNGAFVWGRLPDPDTGNDRSFSTAMAVAGTAGATRIFGGDRVYFIETAPGTIKMWGEDFGRSGVLTSSGRVAGLELGPIPGNASVVDIASLLLSSYIVMDDGSVWTSGASSYGGDGQYFDINNNQLTIREFHPVRTFLPLGSETGNCRDGADNDRDGLTDCADPDCADDVGSAEGNGAISDISGVEWYRYFEASCRAGTRTNREQTYLWTAPRTGTFEFSSGASVADLVLEAFDGCTTNATSLACNDDDVDTVSDPTTIQISAIGGQQYVIVAHGASGGAVSIDINEVP